MTGISENRVERGGDGAITRPADIADRMADETLRRMENHV